MKIKFHIPLSYSSRFFVFPEMLRDEFPSDDPNLTTVLSYYEGSKMYDALSIFLTPDNISGVSISYEDGDLVIFFDLDISDLPYLRDYLQFADLPF